MEKRSKHAASWLQLQLQYPFLRSPFIEIASIELTFLAASRKSWPSRFSSFFVGDISIPLSSWRRLYSFKDKAISFADVSTGIVRDSWFISQIFANFTTRSISSVFVDNSSLRLYDSAVEQYKFLTNIIKYDKHICYYKYHLNNFIKRFSNWIIKIKLN